MHGLDGHASSNLAMVSLAGRSHFEEARAHLGLNLNVNGHHGRLPYPALLALFSIVTLVAHQQLLQHPFELPKAAWYQKTLPTFADALALVDNSFGKCRLFRCRVPM